MMNLSFLVSNSIVLTTPAAEPTLLPPPISTHLILPATIDALNLMFSLGTTDRLLLVVVYRSPSYDVSDDLALLDFLREVVRDPSIMHFLIVGDPTFLELTGLVSHLPTKI